MRPIERVVVGIPARDESATLDACLASIATARRAVPGVSVTTVLVLDACTDASAEIAALHPEVLVAAARSGNVGRSRALAVEAGLDEAPEHPGAVWLAMTDADGTVPEGWLTEHLRAARAADVYVGAVVPELEALDPARRRAWWERHPPGATLGHVHGANLGMRASAYHAVGGFEPLATAEDVDLVARLRARGFAVEESEREPVVTSARLRGRAPGGYADYLAALLPEYGSTA